MLKKENALVVTDEVIMQKIYCIRKQKVMLDKDLAELYHVSTGNLNKAVSRNLKRFPEDFMFQLNASEFKNLMFQNGISNWGGTRKLPYEFTENGMAMLSGLLNSDWAIEVNIRIMRIFTLIRHTLIDNAELRLAFEAVKNSTEKNTKNIELVFKYLDQLLTKKENPIPRKKIGFKLPKKK